MREVAGSGIGVTELVPQAIANAGEGPTPEQDRREGGAAPALAERDGSYAEQLERRSASLAGLLGR